MNVRSFFFNWIYVDWIYIVMWSEKDVITTLQ